MPASPGLASAPTFLDPLPEGIDAEERRQRLGKIASEIVLRFYLTIGFVALWGLTSLSVTSTDFMIRRMGPRWNRLHKTVYILAALALFHYYLQSKADVSDPVMMTGFFLMLMLYRALVKRLPLWGR